MSRSIRGTRDTQEMIALTRDFLAAQSPSRERSLMCHLTTLMVPYPVVRRCPTHGSQKLRQAKTLLLAPSTLRSRKD